MAYMKIINIVGARPQFMKSYAYVNSFKKNNDNSTESTTTTRGGGLKFMPLEGAIFRQIATRCAIFVARGSWFLVRCANPKRLSHIVPRLMNHENRTSTIAHGTSSSMTTLTAHVISSYSDNTFYH